MKPDVISNTIIVAVLIGMMVIGGLWVTHLPNIEDIDGNVDYNISEGRVIKKASNSTLNEYYITIRGEDDDGSVVDEVMQISKVEFENTELTEEVKRSDYNN